MTDRPAGSRALRADAERNRQAILDAAEQVFAEHGVSVTLAQIAKVAGVGVGTIYRRFSGVDALVEELFDERICRWADLVAELAELARTEPWDAFRRYVLGIAESQGCDAAFAELLIEPVLGSQRFQGHHAQAMGSARLLLSRARESGAVRADLQDSDLLHIQLAVLGVVRGTSALGSTAPERFALLVLDACRGPAVPRETVGPLPAPMATELSALESMCVAAGLDSGVDENGGRFR